MKLIETITDAEYTTAATRFRLASPATESHHPLSPSSLYRAGHCHASVLAGLAVGKNEGSKDATDGTRRHELLARLVTGGMPAVADDDSRHVELGRQVLRQAWDQIRVLAAGKPIVQWVEVPFSVSICDDKWELGDEEPKIYGTADFFAMANGIGFLVDWKTGRCVDDAEDATLCQLQAYAAMAIHAHQLRHCYYSAAFTDSGEIRCAGVMSAVQASHWQEEMKALAACVCSPDAEFACVCGNWCRYCPVAEAGRCPVKLAAAATSAPEVHPDAVAIAQQCQLQTAEDADRWLCRLADVMAVVGPMEERAKALVKEAGGTEHFAVVPVKGRETVNWKAVAKAHGIGQRELDEYTTAGEPTAQVRRRK